jgi:hypothetical protein
MTEKTRLDRRSRSITRLVGNPDPGELIVLKTYDIDLDDPNALELFRRELWRFISLSHPCLVRIDCFSPSSESVAHIGTEFAHNGQLRKALWVSAKLPG